MMNKCSRGFSHLSLLRYTLQYTDHVARPATFSHVAQALVELHQHTGEYDIPDICIGDCVPAAVGVEIECRPCTDVEPPTSDSAHAQTAGVVVVILVRGTELHPVDDSP